MSFLGLLRLRETNDWESPSQMKYELSPAIAHEFVEATSIMGLSRYDGIAAPVVVSVYDGYLE